jgi:hypothetical protein
MIRDIRGIKRFIGLPIWSERRTIFGEVSSRSIYPGARLSLNYLSTTMAIRNNTGFAAGIRTMERMDLNMLEKLTKGAFELSLYWSRTRTISAGG